MAAIPPLRVKQFRKSKPSTHKPGKAAFTHSKLADSDPSPIYMLAQKFQEYLHLPDPSILYALMGAVAANMLHGQDPVWLMLVGSSGSGKTALLKSLKNIPNMHVLGDIDTKAAFLSGVKKKEQMAGSKGGLLHEIGKRGGVVWYEFTSVLELPKDALKAILTALRQIFDGYYSRDVGTEGHRKLEWTGRLAAFGGVTNAIDSAHEFSSRMGERFLYYRLPITDGRDEAWKAMEMESYEAMSEDLAALVESFFEGQGLSWEGSDGRIEIGPADRNRIIALGQFATRARSAVERDYRSRDIIACPQPEAPMRVSKMFLRLYLGMEIIGVDQEDRWRVLQKIAMDSMPLTRLMAVKAVMEGKRSAGEIGAKMQVSLSTVNRTLEDLQIHGILQKGKTRDADDEDEDSNTLSGADAAGDTSEDAVETAGAQKKYVKGKSGWELTKWAREKLHVETDQAGG